MQFMRMYIESSCILFIHKKKKVISSYDVYFIA